MNERFCWDPMAFICDYTVESYWFWNYKCLSLIVYLMWFTMLASWTVLFLGSGGGCDSCCICVAPFTLVVSWYTATFRKLSWDRPILLIPSVTTPTVAGLEFSSLLIVPLGDSRPGDDPRLLLWMSNLLGEDEDVTGRTELGDRLDCPIRGFRCGTVGLRSLLALPKLIWLLLLLLSDIASSKSCLPTGCDMRLLGSLGEGDLRLLVLKLSIDVDLLTEVTSIGCVLEIGVLTVVTNRCSWAMVGRLGETQVAAVVIVEIPDHKFGQLGDGLRKMDGRLISNRLVSI